MPSKSISDSSNGQFFLIEFFVDVVYLPKDVINKGNGSFCVSFQFLQYPTMVVCEEDFYPKKDRGADYSGPIVFESGKSCLFSLRPKDTITPPEFDLNIIVSQNSISSSQKNVVGKAVVKFGHSFTALVHTTQTSSLPATLLKQDEFPLRDGENREIGYIAAFIRLSCFGKLIVTQFQLAGGDDMNYQYMFKGTNPSKIFKEAVNYTESQENLTEQEIPGDIPYENVFGYPKESEEFIKAEKMDDKKEKSEEEEELIEEDEQEAVAEMDLVKADEAEPKIDTKEEEEEEDYKEIGAEINGHSITIRVLKKRKKVKKTEVIQDDMDERVHSSCICPDPPCLCAPKLNVCDCDYPLPPELIPRCSQAQRCCPCNPPPGSCCCLQKSQMQNLCTFSGTKRNTTDVEPGVVTMKGDQVFLQMPNRPLGEPVNEKDKKTANSLYYKFSSTEGGKENAKQYVQILPQNPGEPLNNYSASGNANISPAVTNDQDAFLLKLKQTNNSVETKNKLEMELKTQKPKEPKPEMNTINTQYLTTDFPPVKKKVNEAAGKREKKKKK